MAAESPRNKKPSAAPLPISSLPLPDARKSAPEEPDPSALPTGSSGKLTPAQRARLGLDAYGDDQPAAGPPQQQQPPGQPPQQESSSTFDFAAMEPPAAAAPEPEPATPHLAPVQDPPRLAPVQSSRPASALRPATPAGRAKAQDAEESAEDAETLRKREKLSVKDRDGIPEVEKNRTLLGYGVGWSAFCIVVAAIVSAANVTSNPGMGPTPGAFVPAMISIVLGWIVVAIGFRFKAWGYLMIVPAVVLVLGPFVYTNWKINQTKEQTRALLSTEGAKAEIDIDQSSILSSTVNTDAGCFALLKERGSGDLRVDVVTYAPATAQQQATMALAPRFARRVAPGGDRVTQRSFTLAGGKLPVVAIEQELPPIDCAQSTSP
jgi:hypothetical protein